MASIGKYLDNTHSRVVPLFEMEPSVLSDEPRVLNKVADLTM